MTDSEHNRYLRRLCFPKPLEAAFQADYWAKTRPLLQIYLAFLALLNLTDLAFAPRELLDQNRLAILWTVLHSAGHVCLLILTRARWFGQIWQPILVLQLCFTLLVSVNLDPLIGIELVDLRAVLMTGAFIVLLVVYIVVRLQFMWASITGAVYVTAIIWHDVTLFGSKSAAFGNVYYQNLVIFSMLGLFACYYLERLHRSNFLNAHLLRLEREKSETVLQNVLPPSIVDRLKNAETVADDHTEATVLFADIVDFTRWSAQRPALEVLQLLNDVFSRFDRLVEACGLEKIKTVGNCYMVVAGVPHPRTDHLEAMALLALEMQREVERVSTEHGMLVRLRIGVHTGPLAAGIIGEKRFLYDVWGDTVNAASRLEAHGVPGAIQVSSQVADRLQGKFVVKRRGEVEIKGKGLMETYFLESQAPESAPA